MLHFLWVLDVHCILHLHRNCSAILLGDLTPTPLVFKFGYLLAGMSEILKQMLMLIDHFFDFINNAANKVGGDVSLKIDLA